MNQNQKVSNKSVADDFTFPPPDRGNLRDQFAMHAPESMLADFHQLTDGYPKDDPYPKDGTGLDYILWKARIQCRLRYAYADAMIKARNQ